jgi:hypothetical protein
VVWKCPTLHWNFCSNTLALRLTRTVLEFEHRPLWFLDYVIKHLSHAPSPVVGNNNKGPFFFSFFGGGTGFELRALWLLSRCSTTRVTLTWQLLLCFESVSSSVKHKVYVQVCVERFMRWREVYGKAFGIRFVRIQWFSSVFHQKCKFPNVKY